MSLPRLQGPLSAARFISLSLPLLSVLGCDRAGTGNNAATVQETFETIRKCRQARSYAAMRPLLHPSGRDSAIDLLVAVDEMILADAAAAAAAKRASPDAGVPAQLAAQIENRLELFSRDVEFISADERGDVATVTAKIGNRLPLQQLHFTRNEGSWQYLPGETPAGLVAAVRQLTRALNQIELVLSTRQMSPQQVREEYRLRLVPRLKRFEQFRGGPGGSELATVGSAK